MSDFNLFSLIQDQKTNNEIHSNVCLHENVLFEHGIQLCSSCGVELKDNKLFDSNWNCIKEPSNTFVEPNRCYIRKNTERTIYNDIQHLCISEQIKDLANDIYQTVCDKKTKRSKNRKGIIFACVYYAYKLNNNPQSCENLFKIFDIQKKKALNGIKFVNSKIPNDSPIRFIYITPEHIIKEFLNKFEADDEICENIITLYNKIKGKSNILNRSRPQSISAGVIYYYMQQIGRNLCIKDFTKIVGLSELTIHKITKEIDRVLKKIENS